MIDCLQKPTKHRKNILVALMHWNTVNDQHEKQFQTMNSQLTNQEEKLLQMDAKLLQTNFLFQDIEIHGTPEECQTLPDKCAQRTR